MKIAIIGSGISGLGAAWLLHRHHDITVFEKDSRLGGHSRTISVNTEDGPVPVDTGFIVFNNRNYPNLLGLFKALDVPFENSDMSFGVTVNGGAFEYSSKNLFAQPANILNPRFWRMLLDILTFNKKAPAYLDRETHVPLGKCLEELGLSKWFEDYYLRAMGAAIWSTPSIGMLDFPARTFIRFFQNHGLLSINDRPQWYTVTGGSIEYIKRLTEPFKDKIHLNSTIKHVLFENEHVYVFDDKSEHVFDHIIFACHPDQALSLIKSPTLEQKSVIGAFDYQDNRIIVHSDPGFMPKRKGAWASWVYVSREDEDTAGSVSLTYWMNLLQNLKTRTPVLVTLNPRQRPQENLIHDEYSFRHPIFNVDAIEAQGLIDKIQGQSNMWFCGAYQRYGFHEDGLLSAVRVCKKLGGPIPWRT